MDKEVVQYHSDGTIKSVYFLKEGKRHGPIKQWNDRGVLIYDGCFYQGLAEGIHREFYADGMSYTEKSYKRGLLSGRSKEWSSNGNIQSKEWYVEGSLHGKQYYWTEKGKRISTAIHQVAFM